jgi:hypothetical protein
MKLKAAEKVYYQLLEEAREKGAEAAEKYVGLSYKIHKARMMMLAASRDDDLLLAEEKKLLEGWKPLWEEATRELRFWEERLERLQKYDFRQFPSPLETEAEIDTALSDSFNED